MNTDWKNFATNKTKVPSNMGGVWACKGGRQTIEFSVKGPVAVSLDEEQVTSPGCSVLDLLFSTPSQVGELVFRNYYTAWLTVLVRTEQGYQLSTPRSGSKVGTDISCELETNSNMCISKIHDRENCASTQPRNRSKASSECKSDPELDASATTSNSASTQEKIEGLVPLKNKIMLDSSSSFTKLPTWSSSTSNKKNTEVGGWTLSVFQRFLMPNPHQEVGSQDLISIAATESAVDWQGLTAMRLVLRQPSPLWRTFHVEDLSIYSDLPRRVPQLNPDNKQQARYSQNHQSILLMFKCRTQAALKWSPNKNIGEPNKESPTICGYEFFNLPQV